MPKAIKRTLSAAGVPPRGDALDPFDFDLFSQTMDAVHEDTKPSKKPRMTGPTAASSRTPDAQRSVTPSSPPQPAKKKRRLRRVAFDDEDAAGGAPAKAAATDAPCPTRRDLFPEATRGKFSNPAKAKKKAVEEEEKEKKAAMEKKAKKEAMEKEAKEKKAKKEAMEKEAKEKEAVEKKDKEKKAKKEAMEKKAKKEAMEKEAMEKKAKKEAKAKKEKKKAAAMQISSTTVRHADPAAASHAMRDETSMEDKAGAAPAAAPPSQEHDSDSTWEAGLPERQKARRRRHEQHWRALRAMEARAKALGEPFPPRKGRVQAGAAPEEDDAARTTDLGLGVGQSHRTAPRARCAPAELDLPETLHLPPLDLPARLLAARAAPAPAPAPLLNAPVPEDTPPAPAPRDGSLPAWRSVTDAAGSQGEDDAAASVRPLKNDKAAEGVVACAACRRTVREVDWADHKRVCEKRGVSVETVGFPCAESVAAEERPAALDAAAEAQLAQIQEVYETHCAGKDVAPVLQRFRDVPHLIPQGLRSVVEKYGPTPNAPAPPPVDNTYRLFAFVYDRELGWGEEEVQAHLAEWEGRPEQMFFQLENAHGTQVTPVAQFAVGNTEEVWGALWDLFCEHHQDGLYSLGRLIAVAGPHTAQLSRALHERYLPDSDPPTPEVIAARTARLDAFLQEHYPQAAGAMRAADLVAQHPKDFELWLYKLCLKVHQADEAQPSDRI